MNKCHVPITWVNDQTPAINDTHLNQYDGELDTLDDRVITLDTTKAAQSDMLLAFKDVSLNSTTGVITFTLFNNTTKTIDTLLEKIAINFDYDDDPTSPHYQNLIIELEDGTYKYIDMSALITEYEFTDSSTIGFTVTSGAVSASVIDGSITATKCDPTFALAISDAEANGLKSEGYANGTQGGIPVTSGSPYYENNAKYWKEQAQAIASQTLSGLTDVSIQSPQDGEALIYDAANSEWINGKSGILPHVIVLSDTGSTVTLTKGAKVVTATETSTGHFEADVDEYGTWTIDSLLAGDDAQTTLNIDAVKIYTITDEHFSASITVSYPSGGTCTLSATGQTPQVATGSPYTFTVHAATTYTLTATYRGATRTATVAISTTGQTETYSFLVDGATVLTTDDVEIWLDCACLWDKNYTTEAEIIADSEALLALISDNNAVDYMARSASFRTLICADALAMLYIGQYNYCADALLADSTWLAAIQTSEYFELVIPAQIPAMTSNTTPSGECIVLERDAEHIANAYKAFDKNVSTYVTAYTGSTAIGTYIGYIFPQTKRIYKIVGDIGMSAQYGTSCSVSFKFQYTTDGSTWTDIQNSTRSSSFTSGGGAPFIFDDVLTDVECLGIRAYITSATPNSGVSAISRELQFYGREDVVAPATRTLKTFATATEAEIVEMICKADRGEIDLYDDAGWRYGQEHNTAIASIPDAAFASSSLSSYAYQVGESQPAHIATITLSNHGGVELVNSVLDKQGQTRTQCSFEYDWKNCFPESGYMNSSDTNSGSWDECARRKWCNYGLRNAVSPYIRAASKQFKTVTAETYNGSTNKISNDYFALRAEKEVIGNVNVGTAAEAAALTQATLYETSANRFKTANNVAARWWLRTPGSAGNRTFAIFHDVNDNTYGKLANNNNFLSPFGAF